MVHKENSTKLVLCPSARVDRRSLSRLPGTTRDYVAWACVKASRLKKKGGLEAVEYVPGIDVATLGDAGFLRHDISRHRRRRRRDGVGAREGCADDGDSLPCIIISAVRFNRKLRCRRLYIYRRHETAFPRTSKSCVLIRCNKKACITCII